MLVACGGERMPAGKHVGGDTLRMAYAQLLTIVRHADYTTVDMADPWHKGRMLHRYVLVARSDSARVAQAGGLPEGTVVYTPIERSVVFGTPHCQLLYWLGAQGAITGVCDRQYVNIPDVQRRIGRPLAAGGIADCGNGMAPSIERIVEQEPQALLISPFEDNGGHGQLGKVGIPIVECAEYMETSAMARAEWVKFYGLLFGRSSEAEALFHEVDSCYQALKHMAAQTATRRSILTERKTGGVWYVPGGRSSIGMLIADAGGSYVFAADDHSGSLPLALETVVDKAADTDVWAFKYSGSQLLTRADLLNEYQGYKGLKAFQKGEIYECNSTQRPFFEEVSFRPDWLLREFIILLHPELRLGALRYYEKCRE